MFGRGSGSRACGWSTVGGLVAILLWSTTVALARRLAEQVGPLTAATAVYAIGGLACLVQRGWEPKSLARTQPRSLAYLVGCGALFVLYTILLFLALGWASTRSEALEVGLLNYLWPTFTILFSLVLLGERARWWLVAGTLCALAGLVLVMTQGHTLSWDAFATHARLNPAAYGAALAAAVCWALYSNLTRRWGGQTSRSGVAWFMAASALVLLGLRLVVTEPAAWGARAVAEAIALGLMTALAYGLWDVAMRKGDLLLVATASYFTPLLSTLASCLYLEVRPAGRFWIGCGLLVLGSFVSWASVRSGASERT